MIAFWLKKIKNERKQKKNVRLWLLVIIITNKYTFRNQLKNHNKIPWRPVEMKKILRGPVVFQKLWFIRNGWIGKYFNWKGPLLGSFLAIKPLIFSNINLVNCSEKVFVAGKTKIKFSNLETQRGLYDLIQ